MPDTPDASEKPNNEPEIPGEGTPEGDRLREAHAAFERGDYAEVRSLTTKLQGADDQEVAQAAHALRRRVEIDPMQLAVLGACLVFFLWITYKYVFSQ